MEPPDDLPGLEGLEQSPPPFAAEAAALWESVQEPDKSRAAETLILAEGLGKLGLTRNQIVQLIKHVVPSHNKQSRKVEKSPETHSAEKQSGSFPEIDRLFSEIAALLPKLESGKVYHVQDFQSLLSAESPIFAIPTTKGRQTAIGCCLVKLARNGHLQKIKGRVASYRLAYEVTA